MNMGKKQELEEAFKDFADASLDLAKLVEEYGGDDWDDGSNDFWTQVVPDCTDDHCPCKGG